MKTRGFAPFALRGSLLVSLFKKSVAEERVVEEEIEVPVPGPPPIPLAPYRAHSLVQGANLVVCIVCGFLSSRVSRRGPDAHVCPGDHPLPPFAVQALAEGAFDAAILDGPFRYLALAKAKGWIHPNERFFPLEPD